MANAQADIEMKRNDTRPLLDAVLSDASGVVDLTGSTVKFFVADADGNQIISQTSTGARVTLTTASCGAVRYTWASTDLSSAANYQAEWEVTFSDGTIATFPNDGHSTLLVHADLAT